MDSKVLQAMENMAILNIPGSLNRSFPSQANWKATDISPLRFQSEAGCLFKIFYEETINIVRKINVQGGE